jgi:hypothetical protein
MAAMTKNKNFFKWPKLLYFKPESAQIWTLTDTDTVLKRDHPRIISAKFGWDWYSSFRGEDFFKFHPPFFSNLHNRSINGQNCSILSQEVPKFELYKHNDELFNKYYGIFYELWTFAYFDRLCKLEKRGDEIKKKSPENAQIWTV